MKNARPMLLGGFLAVLLITTMALTPPYPFDKPSALVEQIQGIYIFSYSRPVLEYKVIGIVKAPSARFSDASDKCLESLIKRAKDNFPDVEALIVNADFTKAECIRLKQ